MSMRISRAAMAAAAITLSVSGASATMTSHTAPSLQISVTALPSCVVNSVGPINFTNITVGSFPSQQAYGSLNVACPGTLYEVHADGGLHGTIAARNVQNGSATLAYNLYVDTKGDVWGDGTGGTSVFNNGGTLAPRAATPTKLREHCRPERRPYLAHIPTPSP